MRTSHVGIHARNIILIYCLFTLSASLRASQALNPNGTLGFDSEGNSLILSPSSATFLTSQCKTVRDQIAEFAPQEKYIDFQAVKLPTTQTALTMAAIKKSIACLQDGSLDNMQMGDITNLYYFHDYLHVEDNALRDWALKVRKQPQYAKLKDHLKKLVEPYLPGCLNKLVLSVHGAVLSAIEDRSIYHLDDLEAELKRLDVPKTYINLINLNNQCINSFNIQDIQRHFYHIVRFDLSNNMITKVIPDMARGLKCDLDLQANPIDTIDRKVFGMLDYNITQWDPGRINFGFTHLSLFKRGSIMLELKARAAFVKSTLIIKKYAFPATFLTSLFFIPSLLLISWLFNGSQTNEALAQWACAGFKDLQAIEIAGSLLEKQLEKCAVELPQLALTPAFNASLDAVRESIRIVQPVWRPSLCTRLGMSSVPGFLLTLWLFLSDDTPTVSVRIPYTFEEDPAPKKVS